MSPLMEESMWENHRKIVRNNSDETEIICHKMFFILSAAAATLSSLNHLFIPTTYDSIDDSNTIHFCG